MRTPRLRLLSAILAVALFFTLLPVSALAEGGGSTGVRHVATRSLNTDNEDDQGLTYTLNADHTATVANYDNHTPDGVIDIPDTVISGGQPYTVMAIDNAAFPNSAVTSVTIPDSVSSIQFYAFHDCENLKTIRIPVSVTLIEDDAFAGCPSSMTVTYPGSKTQWDKIKGKDELLNIPLVCNKLEATFNPDNGDPTVTKFIDNDKNSKFTELVPEPTKENYTFAGWYNGDETFDFTTVPTGDVTLVAKWDINQYTVKFVSDHGSFADQTIEHGKLIDTGKLTIPEVEGFTFDGWYTTNDTHSTKFDFSTPITGDTTVYAKWTANDYYVSFVTEHGAPPTSQNVK